LGREEVEVVGDMKEVRTKNKRKETI